MSGYLPKYELFVRTQKIAKGSITLSVIPFNNPCHLNLFTSDSFLLFTSHFGLKSWNILIKLSLCLMPFSLISKYLVIFLSTFSGLNYCIVSPSVNKFSCKMWGMSFRENLICFFFHRFCAYFTLSRITFSYHYS